MTDAPLDIAIVIALQEEFEQLYAQIKDRCTPVQDSETSDYDYVFAWPAASAQPYRCVASFAGKMGERKAALVTQRLLARWQSATVVVLGIAGGMDSDVRLGDVVAAAAVESYLEDAKAVAAAEPDRFEFHLAGDTFRPSGDLVKEVRHFKFAHSRQFETWQEDGRRRLYDALPANLRKRKAYAPLLADGPRLFDGPVACGPIVGAAESFVAWLKQQNRKFAALEMESGGVLAAVFEATDPARTLVLRGISDLADHRKAELDQTAGGVFRRVAMNNAIGMLDALLAAGCLPRATVGGSLREPEASARGASGLRCTLRLTQTGDQLNAVLEEPGQPSLRAHAAFDFALTPQDDEDLRWYLEDFLQHPFEPAPTIAARIEARMAEIGGELFDRVFGSSEQGRRLWARAAERLSDLRVEVVAGVRDAQAVPWELLRDCHTDTVLALRAAAFVRTHDEPAEPPQPVGAQDGPIRILLVICRPRQADDVPFRSVASRLVKALSAETQALYQLDVLRPATFAALAARLRAAKAAGRPYHVVHFDGHGMYAEVADRETIAQWLRRLVPLALSGPRAGSHGYLLFEDPQAEDNLQLVDGLALGRLLKETGVPVLVLNACRSAHAEAPPQPSAASADEVHAQVRAFGSLAQEVIDCGVTGVVAMRYNVYVVTAAQFVADLYAALLQGAALGEAVTLGRKQLAAHPQRTIAYDPRPLADWCVPVVYEALPTPLFPPRDARPSLAAAIAAAESTAGVGGLDPDLPPPPDAGFFGRDETLLALDRALDTQSVVLLHALAGSGKTATVAEFARWYAFTGGVQGPVLFTSFEHHTPLARVLDRIGQVFGAALEQAGVHWLALDDAARRQVALQVLQQVPVLWIWDNVEPIAGFPAGSPSAWTDGEQRELADFLRAAARTKARFLLTSRREERTWLVDLPRRIDVPPMPMQERVQLARGLAEKHGRRLTDVEDWLPLLRYTQGNPLTITVLVGQALNEGLRTKQQFERFVADVQAGETRFSDDPAQGRSRSLSASLSFGFEHAFTAEERAHLALLVMFQGVVDVTVLEIIGDAPAPWGVEEIRGLSRDYWIRLLDRALELGLLAGVLGGGVYWIHPAVPWFLKQLFNSTYGKGSPQVTATLEKALVRSLSHFAGILCKQYGPVGSYVVWEAHEWNLRHAIELAIGYDLYDEAALLVQTLYNLLNQVGRRSDWHRLIEQIEGHYFDAETGWPVRGRDLGWMILVELRAMAARQARRFGQAERIHAQQVEYQRIRVSDYVSAGPEEVTPEQLATIENLVQGLARLGEYQCLQHKKDCVSALEEAYSIASHYRLTNMAALSSYNLGIAYHQVPDLTDYEEAERWYAISSSLREKTDVQSLAQCLHQRAGVAFQQFECARADAWRFREHTGADSEEYRDAVDRAEKYFNRAAAFSDRAIGIVPSNAVDDLARMHHQRGLLYGNAGDIPAARHHYSISISLDEQQGDFFEAARSRKNFAVDLARKGMWDEAIVWARAALDGFEKYGDRAQGEIDATREMVELMVQDSRLHRRANE